MKFKTENIWGNTRPKRIACIGEAMVELTFETPDASSAFVSIAGDVLNTAVYLKRNWNGHVAFVTAVGNDTMSDRLLSFMEKEGLSNEFVERSNQRTIGLYSVSTDSVGERSFSYWRNQSAARRLFQTNVESEFSALESFDAIYLSAITLAILPNYIREKLMDWLAQFRQLKGGIVIFDSNYRPNLWENRDVAKEIIRSMWKVTDIGLPTHEDEREIFGDRDFQETRARLLELGVSCGAVKCGARGPVPVENMNDTNTYLPVNDVVDTTAAGDSFNGAFLAAWANGKTISEAMNEGHVQAGLVLTQLGAFGRV